MATMETPKGKRRLKLKPTLKPYSHRSYKWAVYYQGPDGQRARRKFHQKNAAAEFLADKQVEAENLGNRIASALGDDLKREAYDAQELLKPYGKSLIDAARFYRAHLEATAKSESLGQAKAEFVAAMEKAGKSARYVGELKHRVDLFTRSQPDRLCAEVSTREIAQWLSAAQVSNTTRNNNRRVLSTFFSWCARMGYCPDNPVAKVDRSKNESNGIGIYTPAEMAKILHAAAVWDPAKMDGKPWFGTKGDNRDILANMAICGFAGLRQAEFERLSWAQIKIDRNVIDLSAAITKTAARRIVKIRPVLQAWFENIGSFGMGLVCQPNFSTRIRAFRAHLAKQHNLEWRHNALRHSFASYLMEEVQNPGEVSLQLGHGDAGVVFHHYRELVTAEDTKEYWNLNPNLVLRAGAKIVSFKRKAVS
jgi:integrase